MTQCPKSCGECTPDYLAKPDDVRAYQESEIRKYDAAHGVVLGDVQKAKEVKITVVDTSNVAIGPLNVNPFLTQQQYSSGQLTEEENLTAQKSGGACYMKGRPNGDLLDRIVVASHPTGSPPIRIFCGIYTMEKNHATNVKATKNTWAKRCDGFIAFSTTEDAAIPSVKIEHEGEESYDNMWQKSRSIWKFIGKHLVDKFDFFVLGGDDMFYIVENLRAYLSSPEIMQLKESREGKISCLVCEGVI
jgi:hypothetical protein